MSKLKPIMLVGTGSDMGRSIVVIDIYRILLQKGCKLAPFEAQNMSLNSYPTPEEGEIGRTQAVQTEACGIPCHIDMNLIFLEPTVDQTTQMILHGRVVGNQLARSYFNVEQRKPPFVEAMRVFDRLTSQYNPIAIGGAGSISEVNLWPMDVINIWVALRTGADVYLVAGIERGGIFDGLYGTIKLLPPAGRAAVKGIIINKSRGDSSFFDSGRKTLQDLTKVPVVGLLPYLPNIQINAEDGVSINSYVTQPRPGMFNVAVIRLSYVFDFTDFDPLRFIFGATLYFTSDAEMLRQADIIVFPSSKNAINDLFWLQVGGPEAIIQTHYKAGRPLYGIYGGYQMMGLRITDSDDVEGEPRTIHDLGFLPTETTLQSNKAVCTSTFTYFPMGIPDCQGYEIHCGITQPIGAPELPVVMRAGETPDDYQAFPHLRGSYMHGIWDNEVILQQILYEVVPERTFHLEQTFATRKAAYDRLVEHMRQHLGIEYMFESLYNV